MTWRDRTDFWYGRILLRPLRGSQNEELGGAYVSFAVVDHEIVGALARLGVEVAKEGWQLTSVESMKRACDYHDDDEEDDIIARKPTWLDLIADAERDGLSLGAFHTFRADRRKQSLQ